MATETLAAEDVDALMRLVAAAGDPTSDHGIPDRKRALIEGVSALVGADIWYWSTSVVAESSFDMMALTLIDGGWRDMAERVRFFETVSDPRLAEGNQRLVELAGAAMWTRDVSEVVPYEASPVSWQLFAGIGIEHMLISTWPVQPRLRNVVGLYRRTSRPRYTARDRLILHLALKHLDWLNRDAAELAAPQRALRLSRRERQVLAFLVAGHSPKAIAYHLAISPHTVGDYIKGIYRHFSVSGRAELLSQFIGGSPGARD